MQALYLSGGCVRRQQRDAASVVAQLSDGRQQTIVVVAIARGLHHDGALQADGLLCLAVERYR